MKKRILLLIVMVTMVGALCACEKQSTGIVKMTGGKEQTAGEKEKVSGTQLSCCGRSETCYRAYDRIHGTLKEA